MKKQSVGHRYEHGSNNDEPMDLISGDKREEEEKMDNQNNEGYFKDGSDLEEERDREEREQEEDK